MLAEWAAFERFYGPLLIHERVDFGMAALRATVAGGGTIAEHLPPWYDTDQQVDEGGIVAALTRFAEKGQRGE